MSHDAALILWATLRDRVIADVAVLPEAMNELAAQARTSLKVSGAGVLVATDGRRRAVLGASDNRMHRLEQLQATFDEGPCMDAIRSGRFAGEPDLSGVRERWAVFGPAAVDAGIQATFSFPVTVGEIMLGALDCYRARPGALTPTQISTGALFADIAADLIMHAQSGAGVDAVIEHLTRGDAAPGVVDRACGMTAARLGISVERALQQIREHARDHHVSLDEVAAAIVDGRLRIHP